jgi:hypothetical protein
MTTFIASFLIVFLFTLLVKIMWGQKKRDDLRLKHNTVIIAILDGHKELHKMTRFKIKQLELEIENLKKKVI